MKAVVRDRYGPPDVLRIEEVPVPVPGPGEVRLRVAAVSLNLSDWEVLTGRPAYSRIGGLRHPKHRVLGSDVAGWVDELGAGVEGIDVGDRVVGDLLDTMGGFAEQLVAPATALVPVPDGLGMVEASTIPQSGAIAHQGIAEQPTVHDGSRLLVIGAGGGSGAFAVQLAKAAGAHVTGVDHGWKLDHLRDLGVDEAIDHRVEDITRSGRRFDHVLDLVAHRSVFAYRRLLAPGGRYLCVGGTVPSMLQAALIGSLVGRDGARLGVLAVRQGPSGFQPVLDRCAAGELRAHVGRTFELDEVPEALRAVGEGRVPGKAVIRVAGAD